MALLTAEYRELQMQLHAQGEYGIGSHVEKCSKWIRENAEPGSTVLDYGCGQGHLKPKLDGYDVREYDPCIEGKDGRPDRADYVVCADVLEHVEPEHLDTVISHIHLMTGKKAYFVIDMRPAVKSLPDGRNAHLIIEGPDFWRSKLAPFFRMVEFQPILRDEKPVFLIAVCEPSIRLNPIRSIGVVSNEERNRNSEINVGVTWRRVPSIKHQPHDRTLIVVGYGPSLQESWKVIEEQRKTLPKAEVVSVSGGHDFLWKKGIRPDYHVECDPRLHKSDMMKKPLRGVKYLIASCCHPEFVKRLADYDLALWHLFNGDDSKAIRDNLPSERHEIMFPGGGSVGLRTFVLFYFLGYRTFVVHGFDCSFSDDGVSHAGPHKGKKLQEMLPIRAEGSDRWFRTSPALVSYAMHFCEELKMNRYPGATFFFMGDGLLQEMCKSFVPFGVDDEKPRSWGKSYFNMTDEDMADWKNEERLVTEFDFGKMEVGNAGYHAA